MQTAMNRRERIFLDGIFLLVLTAFTLAFFRLMEPFLLSVFLAAVLVNIFQNPYRRLLGSTGSRRVAALLTTAMIVLVVLIPVVIVTGLVTAEALGIAETVSDNWEGAGIAELVQGIPDRIRAFAPLGALLDYVPEFDFQETVRELLKNASDYLIRLSQRSIGNVAGVVFGFLIMLVLVFFFFIDGERIVERLKQVIPLSARDIDEITREMLNTTSATLISTIIIGLMEGALATVLFLVFRLPSPFLWGVITMVLSMIPLVGTNLVLVPAGLAMLLTGRPLAGIAILVTGAGGVAITQNLIRPKLLGHRTGLHPALALLATVGGIAWLGLIGFLVGPVLASLFIVTWRQFGVRYRTLLADKDDRGVIPDAND